MDASLWDRPIAAPAGPAAADRVRVTDPAGRPGYRPVDETGNDAA